jgi:hypothetical protein
MYSTTQRIEKMQLLICERCRYCLACFSLSKIQFKRADRHCGTLGLYILFKGGIHINSRALLDINLMCGEEGDILLAQMISTCRRCAYRKGGRGQHPVVSTQCLTSVGTMYCTTASSLVSFYATACTVINFCLYTLCAGTTR